MLYKHLLMALSLGVGSLCSILSLLVPVTLHSGVLYGFICVACFITDL